jgi:hypothetical protein
MKQGIAVFTPKHEDVYDWSGNQLQPVCRQHVGENNIVRIQIVDRNTRTPEAVYVKIVTVQNDTLSGEVLPDHRQDEEFVQNGDIITFARQCIIEIPFPYEDAWHENANLQHLEHLTTGLGRTITGIIDVVDNDPGIDER